jgi:hypothetical protein
METKFENHQKKPSYCCVLLDEESHQKAVNLLPAEYEDWKVHAHHMTIKLGSLPESLKEREGQEVTLTCNQVGFSDKALALRVRIKGMITELQQWYRTECGKKGRPQFPHITLAVNPQGGKPVMSNDIKAEDWDDIDPLILTGKITEI